MCINNSMLRNSRALREGSDNEVWRIVAKYRAFFVVPLVMWRVQSFFFFYMHKNHRGVFAAFKTGYAAAAAAADDDDP